MAHGLTRHEPKATDEAKRNNETDVHSNSISVNPGGELGHAHPCALTKATLQERVCNPNKQGE